MPTELDELMAQLEEDPVAFGSKPENIDKIIEYQRKARAMYDSGIKPKKGGAAKVEASALLNDLGLGKPKPTGSIKRI